MPALSLRRTFSVLAFALLLVSPAAFAQTTAFTYQGRLTDNGSPASGQYDLEFKLFDTATVGTGTQIGTVQTLTNFTISNGVFTVQLNFGDCPTCFNGAARFLEIAVRPTGGGTFEALSPRQPLTSAPYAIRSANAAAADGLSMSCVNCVTSSQIQSVNGSAVTGTIPVASVPAGSASYIQNGTSQQASSHFHISGNGTAGGTLSGDTVNAATQFNLGGQRVLSGGGTDNLFVGRDAGAANTGGFNAFFGGAAGFSNTTGSENAFFGSATGVSNTTGFAHAFFGSLAGFSNTTGSVNSFFGHSAGNNNTTGDANAFFGRSAGFSNTTGGLNSFFGHTAGSSNTAGISNTFIGSLANFTGTNSTGNDNTLLGSSTEVTANLTNATAIGARARVTQSNSLVLGSINGVNFAAANTNVGIGTTAPAARLQVVTDQDTNPGVLAAWDGRHVVIGGTASSGGIGMSYDQVNGVGYLAALSPNVTWRNLVIQSGGGNVGIGTTAPQQRLHVDGNEILSSGSQAGFKFRNRGSTSSGDDWVWYSDGNLARFFRAGVGDLLTINTLGVVSLNALGAAGSTQLCRNASNQIATCSSSLRYKTDVRPFAGGLDILSRLRPIAFTWRQGGGRDVGFGAEEVAAVEPLFTFSDERGQVEGVKYDRLSVVLVNAAKELKAENDALKQTVTQQGQQIEALKKLVCLDHPAADVCK